MLGPKISPDSITILQTQLKIAEEPEKDSQVCPKIMAKIFILNHIVFVFLNRKCVS